METTSKPPAGKMVRHILGSLLILLAINAFGGGIYAMTGAKDVPVEWLQGSPFSDYFIPGMFLFIAVGGTALTAAVAVFAKHNLARKAAFACALITLLWIIVQVSIIGYVSWMQPATAATAILILLLARQLPVNEKYFFGKNT